MCGLGMSQGPSPPLYETLTYIYIYIYIYTHNGKSELSNLIGQLRVHILLKESPRSTYEPGIMWSNLIGQLVFCFALTTRMNLLLRPFFIFYILPWEKFYFQ